MATDKDDLKVDYIVTDNDGNPIVFESKTKEEFEKERQETKDALFKIAVREARQNYAECVDYMTANFEEMDPVRFYEELFPNNETHQEALQNTHYQQPNAVFLYKTDTDKQHRMIMYKDSWENDFLQYVENNNLALCGGLAYRGNKNLLANAQRMNALIIDLDGVRIQEIQNFLELSTWDPASKAYAVPRPTFIALSGSGLHLYYQFDRPIDLFPNIKLQLKQLKYKLTFRCWQYKSTSTVKDTQYQSINQAFRMVGSTNHKYGTPVVAFRTGDKVTLDYLNSYVKPEFRVDITRQFQPTKMSLKQAQESYPEWYERKIVKKDRSTRKRWEIEKKVHGKDPYALYHWWLSKAEDIKGGHRYFFMMNLTIYACKCDVPKETLEKDIRKAFDILSKAENHHPDGSIDELNERDIQSALETYDKAYYCWTLSDVETTSGLIIPRNRRNGRKKEEHIRRITALRDLDYPDGSWRNTKGRPAGSGTAQGTVSEWQKDHPTGKKADCIRDTGLSKHTVYKWWSES